MMAMQTQTIDIVLPRPLPWQRQVRAEAQRFNAAAIGRRAGKSTMGYELAIHPALDGLPVAWFAPNYKLLGEAWRDVKRTVRPITRTANTSDHRIELLTGGVIEMWTLEDEDAGRSRKYKRVIVDEAGLVADLADRWHEAIRPTLADLLGDAFLFGTPKGRNFFWELYRMGQDIGRPDWASWQLPTSVNPRIAPSEIEDMRQMMPAQVFAAEILAEFTDSGGAVFREDDIAAAEDGATGERPPEKERRYLTAVDVGRRQDATVIWTIDYTDQPYQVVAFDRLERIPYPLIQQRIADRARAYPGKLMVESNGVGDPLIENLDVYAEPFVTTAKSKVQAIQALALLLEQHRIKARWPEAARRELLAYQWDDRAISQDTVMALAIAATELVPAYGYLGIDV